MQATCTRNVAIMKRRHGAPVRGRPDTEPGGVRFRAEECACWSGFEKITELFQRGQQKPMKFGQVLLPGAV